MMQLAKADKPLFTEADIDALVKNASKEFKADFLLLIEHLAGEVDVATIQQAMLSGDLGQAIISTEKLAAGLAGVWAEVYTGAAQEASQALEDTLHLPIRFDVVNTRAVAAVQGTQLRLIQEMAQEQTDVLREVLTDGVARGLNPREVARELRESIGLTRYQESIVQSYRRSLEAGTEDALNRALRDARFDPTVERYLGSRAGIPAAQVNRMVDAYRANWVNYRATTIARTEGLRAVSEGIQAGFEQAAQTGDVPAADIQRTWATRIDGREREWHASMNGQRRGLTEPFQDGEGNLLMYPRDPVAPPDTTINCRCRVLYRLS